jgi:Zn-dependent protease with chaperone function
VKYVQRDLGEAAENSSGGGRKGLTQEILTLSGLTLAALIALYFLAAWVTDLLVAGISPQREAALFADFGAAYAQDAVPEDLEARWQSAEATLDNLLAYEGIAQLDYQLAYSSEAQANAFAVPGGVIVLTRGLLESLDEKIAVAFVLAHELGHFAGRHHLKRLGRQIGFGGGVMLLTGGSSDRLLQNSANLVALNYSRKQEVEADRFAMDCLHAIYADTNGAEKLFQLLEADSQLPGWAYMFMTHPDTKERIRMIEER